MSPDGDLEDKRQSERVQILGELRGEVMVFEAMTIREIGEGGAQVETRVQLQLNSLHSFRLSLGTRSVVVRGRVVHCRIAEIDQDAVIYCAGIEFVELPGPVAAAIADFLQFVRAARNTAH